MLSRVVIKNFKSIGSEGVDLRLKPLTILVGPNGGGKSKILEAIAFCSDEGNLGNLIKDPSFQHLVHKPTPEAQGTIEIYFGKHKDWGARYTLSSGGYRRELLYHRPAEEPAAQSDYTAELKRKAYLISASRGRIAHSYLASTYPDWVGIDGENLLPLLARIIARRQYAQIEDRILRWAKEFGVGGLKAGIWQKNELGADYLDEALHAPLNLALASSGARQILTIIVQLFWCAAGSINLIEEPEISLHPEGQVKLCRLFAEVIAEQKQIVITTHSHFLLVALGGAVQDGVLMTDELAVYHIEKKERRGTIATPLELDESGYIKGWIPSYSDVEKRLLQQWVKSLPEA
jgi:predicted ATPase